MQRSEVNKILETSDGFNWKFGQFLPAFADQTPEQMRSDAPATIRERRFGWDITDYGEGRFDTLGLQLFTTRNGSLQDLKRGKGMLYAEKIMITWQNQYSPMHPQL